MATKHKATEVNNTNNGPSIEKEAFVANDANQASASDVEESNAKQASASTKKVKELQVYAPNRNFQKRRKLLIKKAMSLLRRTRNDLLITFNFVLEDVDELIANYPTTELEGKQIEIMQVCYAFSVHCLASKEQKSLNAAAFHHKQLMKTIRPHQHRFLAKQWNKTYLLIDYQPPSAVVKMFFKSWNNAKDHIWDACLVSFMAFFSLADQRWLTPAKEFHHLKNM